MYCENCGTELPKGAKGICPDCGQQASRPTAFAIALPHKDHNVATVIAIIGGVLGFLGIGHFYVGRIARGIALLLGGFIVPIFIGATIIFFGGGLFSGSSDGSLAPSLFIALTIFAGVYIFIWVWQVLNARTLARKYNEHVKATCKAPW